MWEESKNKQKESGFNKNNNYNIYTFPSSFLAPNLH